MEIPLKNKGDQNIRSHSSLQEKKIIKGMISSVNLPAHLSFLDQFLLFHGSHSYLEEKKIHYQGKKLISAFMLKWDKQYGIVTRG